MPCPADAVAPRAPPCCVAPVTDGVVAVGPAVAVTLVVIDVCVGLLVLVGFDVVDRPVDAQAAAD